MISFKDLPKSRPIGIIKGGKNNDKIIFSKPDFNKNNEPEDILNGLLKNNDYSKKDMSLINEALENKDTEQIKKINNILTNRDDNFNNESFKIYDEGILQPLPRFKQTERIYITGQTECGKSYFIKQFLKQYRKVYKSAEEKPIFLFSDVDEDEEIDAIPGLTRFHLDEELAEKDNINPRNFKDSICVFDDIDSIQNKRIFKLICNFRDALLRRGRHENISTIITNHLSTDFRNTRIVLNECNSIVIFPHSGSTHGMKYLLQKYVGLDKKGIDKVLKLPSRWVLIHKNTPQYVMYEKGVYII
jgi:hypothetical protein